MSYSKNKNSSEISEQNEQLVGMSKSKREKNPNKNHPTTQFPDCIRLTEIDGSSPEIIIMIQQNVSFR